MGSWCRLIGICFFRVALDWGSELGREGVCFPKEHFSKVFAEIRGGIFSPSHFLASPIAPAR